MFLLCMKHKHETELCYGSLVASVHCMMGAVPNGTVYYDCHIL